MFFAAMKIEFTRKLYYVDCGFQVGNIIVQVTILARNSQKLTCLMVFIFLGRTLKIILPITAYVLKFALIERTPEILRRHTCFELE